MRRRLITVTLAMIALLAAASPVQAATSSFVDIYGCLIFFEGKTAVDANTDITLAYRWGSKTRRQGLEFLEAARPRVRIDGTPVEHPNTYWSLPRQLDKDLWLTEWTYGGAGQLKAGERMLVKLQVHLSERVWDGFQWWEAGNLFESPIACKIKAV
jgi:hypothetical protein